MESLRDWLVGHSVAVRTAERSLAEGPSSSALAASCGTRRCMIGRSVSERYAQPPACSVYDTVVASVVLRRIARCAAAALSLAESVSAGRASTFPRQQGIAAQGSAVQFGTLSHVLHQSIVRHCQLNSSPFVPNPINQSRRKYVRCKSVGRYL